MAWVSGFHGWCDRRWRGSVGWRWLVWVDGGLGLMVGFVPLGLVSSLSLNQAQMVGLLVVWGASLTLLV